MTSVQIASIVSIIVYIAVILVIARILGKQTKMAGTVGKKLPWYIIAACTMATITNAAQILGNAGGAYQMGSSQMFWVNIFCAMANIVTVPLMGERLRDVRCNTMADLSSKRFPKSRRMNVVLTGWNVIWGVFACALSIFGGAVVLQTLLGIGFWAAAILTLVVAIVYNALGGLEAMSVVDTVQYIVIGLLVGILTPVLFVKFGSFSSFVGALVGTTGYNLTAAGEALGIAPGFFDIFNLPGWGVAGFCAYIFACCFWGCCDLGIIERFLAQRAPGEGVKGIRAYTIIFLPTIILMFSFGLWGRAMFASLDYPDSVVLLVAEKAMGGLGTVLFMIAVVAAILSTVGAYINALGLVSTNIYKSKVPNKSDKHYFLVEIISTAAIGIVSLLGAKLFGQAGIAVTCVAIQMILVATLFPTLMFTCFWKRFSEKAAFWGIVVGMAVCIASTVYAGGPYPAVMGGGFFGIPTLFLGWIVTLPIFIIASLITPYDPEATGPEFKALFAQENFLKNYPGRKDMAVTGVITVALIAVCALGLSGKLGILPTFDNAAVDVFLLAASAVAVGGVIFLGYKLVRFMFIDKDFYKADGE